MILVFFLLAGLYRNNIHKYKYIILQSVILLNRNITSAFLTPLKRPIVPCIILVVKKRHTLSLYRLIPFSLFFFIAIPETQSLFDFRH